MGRLSDAEVYASQLLRCHHGYPLWKPKPYESLPELYRLTGTRLGDVGRITHDGHFHFLFNVLAPADDPVNARGVPDDFEPLFFDSSNVLKCVGFHVPGEPIYSLGTKRYELAADATAQILGTPAEGSSGIELKFEDREGALLLLPEGATRVDVENLIPFRQYAHQHCESWYRFAESRGIEVENGALYFVTGYDKTNSWENAVFSRPSRNASVSLKLTSGIGPGGKLQLSQSTNHITPVVKGRNPPDCGMNQSVFIRGFKITLRSTARSMFQSPIKLMDLSSGKLRDLKPSDVIARGSPVRGTRQSLSRSQSSSSSSLSRSYDTSGRSLSSRLGWPNFSSPVNQDESRHGNRIAYSDSEDSDPDSDMEYGNEQLDDSTSDTDSDDEFSFGGPTNLNHPSNVLNDHLLDLISDCDVAITHDNDWCELLYESDSEMPLDEELIARAMSKYEMVNENGCVFFQTTQPVKNSESSYYMDETVTLLYNSLTNRASHFSTLIAHLHPSPTTPPVMNPQSQSQYYLDEQDTPQIFVEPPVEEDVIDGQHLNNFPLPLGSHEGAGYYSDSPSSSQNMFGPEQGLFSNNGDQSTSQMYLITHDLQDGGFSRDLDPLYTQPCGTVSSGNVFLSPFSPAGQHSPVVAAWSRACSSSSDVFLDHVSDDGSSGWSPAVFVPSSPSLSPINQSLNSIALTDALDDGVPFSQTTMMSRQRSHSYTGVPDFSADQTTGRPRSASFTENTTFDGSIFFADQTSGQFVQQPSPDPFMFPGTFDFSQFSSNVNAAPASPSWDSADSSSQHSSPQFPPHSPQQQLYNPPIGPPSGHPTHGRSQSTHLTVPRIICLSCPVAPPKSRSSSRSRGEEPPFSPFSPYLSLDTNLSDYTLAGPSMMHPTPPSSVSLSRSQSPASPASSIDITVPHGQDTSIPVINVINEYNNFHSFDFPDKYNSGVRFHTSYAGTGSRSSSPSRPGPSGLQRFASDPSGRRYPRKARSPNQVRKFPGLLKPAEDVDDEETYKRMKGMEGTISVDVNSATLNMGLGVGLEMGDATSMGGVLKVGTDGGFKEIVGSDKILKASGDRRKNDAKFRCEKCGNSFTAKHNLINHLTNSYNGVRPFECTACHASFRCEKCSYSFTAKHNLIYHLNSHEKYSNSFTAKHNLINHLNSHNGVRPFECTACHASFRCEKCGNSFTAKHNLINCSDSNISFTTNYTHRHVGKWRFTEDRGKLATKHS